MGLEFNWNAEKAAINRAKHRVSFEEASTVFGDPLSVTVPDPGHSDDEGRFVIVGQSFEGKLLVVVHTELADSIRIISARHATRREREVYEQS